MRYLIFVLAVIFLWACGQREEIEYKKIPYEGEQPTGEKPDKVSLAVAEIKSNCVSCHSSQVPVFTDKSSIIAAKTGICKVFKAGSMPPSGPLPDPKVKIIQAGLCN